MKSSVGIKAEIPKQACKDKHCPFHSELSTHGRIFTGAVIKKNVHKTASISWGRQIYLPKYERYEKKRTRVKAHIPDCLNIIVGNKVRIMECAPISKTKHFVIVGVEK